MSPFVEAASNKFRLRIAQERFVYIQTPVKESISNSSQKKSKELFFYDFDYSPSIFKNQQSLLKILFDPGDNKVLKDILENIISKRDIRMKYIPLMKYDESDRIKSNGVETTILSFNEFIQGFFSPEEREGFSSFHQLSTEFFMAIGGALMGNLSEFLSLKTTIAEKTKFSIVGILISIYWYSEYLSRNFSYKDIKEKKSIPPIELNMFKELENISKKRESSILQLASKIYIKMVQQEIDVQIEETKKMLEEKLLEKDDR